MMPDVVGVIPARYAATRFPGKLLADLCGQTVLQRVYERARMASLTSLIIATDSDKIRKAAESFGAKVVMTSQDAKSGTDRIAEALRGMKYDLVVNVQGDEPFMDPAHIDKCIQLLIDRADADVATLAVRTIDQKLAGDPNVVKVVVDVNHMALYFSRSLIPFLRDSGTGRPYWLRHLGLYVYRCKALADFVSSPPSYLEKMEMLEQLRILEAGGRICVLEVDEAGIGIDTPGDLENAKARLISESKG